MTDKDRNGLTVAAWTADDAPRTFSTMTSADPTQPRPTRQADRRLDRHPGPQQGDDHPAVPRRTPGRSRRRRSTARSSSSTTARPISPRSMLAGYGDRIRVVRHETALGFAAACNAGVAAAAGEFVVLLEQRHHPDDRLAGNARGLRRSTIPAAAVVGAKLLFPNDTIQHAGVVFGLDPLPHHIYAGFPADHPATSVSRRFQVVTAACALFRREPWDELGGLEHRLITTAGKTSIIACAPARPATKSTTAPRASSITSSPRRATCFPTPNAPIRALRTSAGATRSSPMTIGYYWVDGLLQRALWRPLSDPAVGLAAAGRHHRRRERPPRRQIALRPRATGHDPAPQQHRPQRPRAGGRGTRGRRGTSTRRGPAGQCNGPTPESQRLKSSARQTAHDEPSVDEPASAGPTVRPRTAGRKSHPAPSAPHRRHGRVARAIPEVITDGVLIVSGWTLTESGDATIEVVINGVSRGMCPMVMRGPTPPALYPGFPAGRTVASWARSPSATCRTECTRSTIRISPSDGGRAELTTTFEIDNHAFETGRVIGRLDQPDRGCDLHPQGDHRRLWLGAWRRPGIRSIEAFVDGEPRGRIDYRALRPDIAKRRRQYADADHCGFSGTVPLHGLTEGSHELAGAGHRQRRAPVRVSDADRSRPHGLDRRRRASHQPALSRLAGSSAGTAAAQDRGGAAPAGSAPRSSASCHWTGDCRRCPRSTGGLDARAAHDHWHLTLVDSRRRQRCRARARAPSGRATTRAFRAATPAATADCRASTRSSRQVRRTGSCPLARRHPPASTAFSRAAQSRWPTAPAPSWSTAMTTASTLRATERWNPFFKPDWSPDLLLAMNYLGPLTIFHRADVPRSGRSARGTRRRRDL